MYLGNGTPLQHSCLENPRDGGAWWAAVHGVAKSRTRLSDFTFHFHALEEEMATHSSVLAWRIPGTGEPGGLPSMGSHRVGHDWSSLAAAAAAGLHCCMQTFPHCSIWPSHCSGFSCFRTQALGPVSFSSCDTWAYELQLPVSRGWAPWLWCMDSATQRHVESSWTRIKPAPPPLTCRLWSTGSQGSSITYF